MILWYDSKIVSRNILKNDQKCYCYLENADFAALQNISIKCI